MNRSKLLLILACLFLVHSNIEANPSLRTFHLNPATKVSPTETSIKEIFAREFNILAFALGLYNLDTRERLSKEDIKKLLAADSAIWEENFAITFDLDNIDFKKKGFTRYYPFTVGGKDFIIRIFDIGERHYLPDFEVFYEGVFEESRIGFQILPGIKTILQETKAEKVSFCDPAAYSTHP